MKDHRKPIAAVMLIKVEKRDAARSCPNLSRNTKRYLTRMNQVRLLIQMIQVRAQSRHLRIQVIVSVLKTNFSFSMKVMYAPLCLEGSGLYFSEGRLKDSTHFIKYLKMTSEDFFCSFFFFFCSFFHSRLKFFAGFCRLLWNLPTLEILDDTEGIESMETRKVLSL